jgi:hypothetical protein
LPTFILLYLEEDLSPGPSPSGEGSNIFSEFLVDISPKNSEFKNFSPFAQHPVRVGKGGRWVRLMIDQR